MPRNGYESGTQQLRAIRRYQKSVDNLTSWDEFTNLMVSLHTFSSYMLVFVQVKVLADISKERGEVVRIHEDALFALQIAAEDFLVALFREQQSRTANSYRCDPRVLIKPDMAWSLWHPLFPVLSATAPDRPH